VNARPTGPRWLKLRIGPWTVKQARQFAAYVLDGAGVEDREYIDDVALVVSELVTNGLHVAGKLGPWPYYATPVHVGVAVRPRWTHIYVVDPDPALPAPAPTPNEDDLLNESGRGLTIVGELAGMPPWIVQGRYGKTVHVVICAPGVEPVTAQEQDALRRRAIV
jgi:anti-sigma regulatory factor (Ser/Thr protein kinase)